MEYLVTVAFSAHKTIVRICINICVLPTFVTITSPTNTALRLQQQKKFIITYYSDKYILTLMPVGNTYHTTNASVSLHNALPIDVTRVWLTIGAQSGAMTACQLVTSETSPTLSTSEGALRRMTQSETTVLIY